MRRAELQVSITPAPDGVTVTMVGEAHFDFDAADNHIHDILSHQPKTVIIDATKLSFVSSVGMCFLINLRRAVRAGEGTLRIAGLQPMVQNALKHAHVLHFFETYPDLSAAREKAKV